MRFVLMSVMITLFLLYQFIKTGNWCVPISDNTQRCVVMEVKPR